MGLEYVYAYLENIAWCSSVLCLISGVFFVLLIIARIKNSIDRDDWAYLMMYVIPIFFFFLTLTLSPGMEHIKEVRKRMISVYNEPKPEEKKNEVSSESINPHSVDGVSAIK